MKAELKPEKFTPFEITLKVETHEEFKALYLLAHDSAKTLGPLMDKLYDYSKKMGVSV